MIDSPMMLLNQKTTHGATCWRYHPLVVYFVWDEQAQKRDRAQQLGQSLLKQASSLSEILQYRMLLIQMLAEKRNWGDHRFQAQKATEIEFQWSFKQWYGDNQPDWLKFEWATSERVKNTPWRQTHYYQGIFERRCWRQFQQQMLYNIQCVRDHDQGVNSTNRGTHPTAAVMSLWPTNLVPIK